jgi:hypothetical protein
LRSHLLRDLSIEGREQVLAAIPNFDFYNLREISRLVWTKHHESDVAELSFSSIYSDGSTAAADIACSCSGVRLVRVPELQSSFWLSEIEVEELTGDQIEGVRYRLREFGGGCFEVLCATIKLSLQQDPLT